MAKNKIEKPKVAKLRKVRVKESKSMSDDNYIDIDAQAYFNGVPCGNKNCNKKLECPECHRINSIGNVEIMQRTGPVHLERMAKYDIITFNKLPEDIRAEKTLKIYFY